MSESDRLHWDDRYWQGGPAPGFTDPPPIFADVAELFPATGYAIDVACGRGRSTAWLAGRGMEVFGIDVSPVAIELARDLVGRLGLANRCSFEVVDVDDGLPSGPLVDLVLCHLFRDPALDQQLIARVKPGGLVALACLSEVGAGPGRYRFPAGELRRAVASLKVIFERESDGVAAVLARRPATGTD